MSERTWVRALWCSLALAVASCGGNGSSVTDCPSYVVVPDGGPNGFSSVGEWRTDSVCAQYCLSIGLPSVQACDGDLRQVSEGLPMMQRQRTSSVKLPNKALNLTALRAAG